MFPVLKDLNANSNIEDQSQHDDRRLKDRNYLDSFTKHILNGTEQSNVIFQCLGQYVQIRIRLF